MSSADKPCPACHELKSFRPTHPKGFWEKKFFSLMGIAPFRCKCGHRVLRLRGRQSSSHPTQETAGQDLTGSPSQFLPSRDDQNFKDLILKIRQTEKKMELKDQEPKH